MSTQADDQPSATVARRQDDVAGNAMSVAKWTLVSRTVGFARVAVIASVLGPTYFGNTFQATNLFPNLTYEFLTGSLFTALLVPVLVRHVDGGDRRGAHDIAGGFLGLTLAAFGVVTVIVIAAGSFVMELFSFGVSNAAIAAQQRRVGWAFMAMLMPQVLLYAVAAVGVAVQNAHGRFKLAAAAPAFESIGIIVTMLVYAAVFGVGTDIRDVRAPQLLLLGLGTTAAVGLHAAAQWWGAARCGVRLVPKLGWRNDEVRGVVRRAVPSLGYAGLNTLRAFALQVVANGIAGGVVALQLAQNLYYLPVNALARPVAIAALPKFSRLYNERKYTSFDDELVRSYSLAFFLVVPIAVAYATLARPIAGVVAFGEMRTGIGLVAITLATLAPGLLGEAPFLVATNASYARQNARLPFRSMMVRTVISFAGIWLAFGVMHGRAILITLGLAVSLGNLGGALHLGIRIRGGLPRGTERFGPSLLKTFASAAAMIVVAYPLSSLWAHGGHVGSVAAVGIGATAGIAVYLAAEQAFGSPELRSFRGGMLGFRPKGSS